MGVTLRRSPDRNLCPSSGAGTAVGERGHHSEAKAEAGLWLQWVSCEETRIFNRNSPCPGGNTVSPAGLIFPLSHVLGLS